MESPLCDVPAGTRLIETFGYVPGPNSGHNSGHNFGQGIARRDLHLARLMQSARALGFAHDQSAVLAVFERITGPEPLRCRVTLAQDGSLQLETAAMPAPVAEIRFVIAEQRLESANPLLRHKTTQRDTYDQARAALPKGVEEAILLNERDEVCEGTITNISVTTPDGARLTPPLASGCLAGVYRQSLLQSGTIQEAVLTLNDLRAARTITLMNSLRGQMRAVWAPQCAQFTRIA
ncbi:aminotransferase class IV family protein [Thalassobius sp. S69A]|uniref:aminotransferase class IV family protein n=1 Tax=unclassified Thalassovita TaxID=2619711 RepID=UPI003C7B29A7